MCENCGTSSSRSVDGHSLQCSVRCASCASPGWSLPALLRPEELQRLNRFRRWVGLHRASESILTTARKPCALMAAALLWFGVATDTAWSQTVVVQNRFGELARIKYWCENGWSTAFDCDFGASADLVGRGWTNRVYVQCQTSEGISEVDLQGVPAWATVYLAVDVLGEIVEVTPGYQPGAVVYSYARLGFVSLGAILAVGLMIRIVKKVTYHTPDV